MVRRVAAAAFVVALVAGTLAEQPPVPRAERRLNGYRAIAGDFHVHGYPADGALPAGELAREARRRGLDVIAITDHNRLVSRGSDTGAVLILPGEEITMSQADMVAVGIDRTIDWRGPIAEIAARVHAAGGVAIAAHPVAGSARAYDAAALSSLDGIEAAHPVMFMNERYRARLRDSYRRAVARRAGIAAMGSSDFHFTAPIGVCRTYLLVTSVDAPGVLEAIRAGRTVACDAHGGVVGPTALAGAVAPWCAADTAAARAVGTFTQRIATAIVLLALAVLAAGYGSSVPRRMTIATPK